MLVWITYICLVQKVNVDGEEPKRGRGREQDRKCDVKDGTGFF